MGQEFTVRVEDEGVRVFTESGEEGLIEWCHWLGAIDLLCRKAMEDKPCVEVETKSSKKDSIEASTQFVCVSQSSAPIWIATILTQLNLACVCHDKPQSIELTSDGERVLFSVVKHRDNFPHNLIEVLKDAENLD